MARNELSYLDLHCLQGCLVLPTKLKGYIKQTFLVMTFKRSTSKYEPVHDKTNNKTCEASKDLHYENTPIQIH